MGADGFPYGAVTPDSFGMPDLFGVAPRGFPHMVRGATSGMMFPGRPSQPGAVFPAGGFGMMMGPGRAPFMGGMGPTASNPLRGPRPSGVFALPPAPSSQNNSRSIKRDQRAAANDRNDRDCVETDVVMGAAGESNEETKYLLETLKASHGDQFGGVNSIRNDDSESEDEAPRRSRHGEGKSGEVQEMMLLLAPITNSKAKWRLLEDEKHLMQIIEDKEGETLDIYVNYVVYMLVFDVKDENNIVEEDFEFTNELGGVEHELIDDNLLHK
ncbi:unnamed protein product [Dovyalis caffra]|uniref:Uncharacterized protein n=1 Tax=Dovyalis caffra TaxID=77055 RepID=A0AAV1QVK4_9ROSI|nr:unnamed protein product [Dovyalis caffra]